MITDFHSHVLPQIDDGSKSVEESVAMLRMLAEQGVTRVIATPHFYPQQDSPEAFLKRRQCAFEALAEEMEKLSDLPHVILGAEVYYYNGISDSDVLQELTIGCGKCILIEMPMPPWTQQMYRELAEIYEKQGLIPIIAHIDRYIRPMHTHGILDKLDELPVFVQANADAFVKRNTRQMMLRLLRKGQIHLLGSDCHDLKDRAPNMLEAVSIIERSLGPDAMEHLNFFENKLLEQSE